jgi:uncharacterized protein YukE
MSKTNVTLNEVEDFNKKIKDFSTNIKHCFNNTNQALSSLGEKWRDDHYDRFKSNFKKHSDKLQPLSDELDKYEKHIDSYWTPKIKEIQDHYKK